MVEWAQTTVGRGTSGVLPVSHGDDSNLFVEFYKDARTGEDFIHMIAPGDKMTDWRQPVRETHKQRFPAQWEAYQNQKDQFAGQTRLEEVAWLDEATNHQLRAVGVFTLEQLAAVSDGNLANIGHGATHLRERARKEVDDKRKVEEFEKKDAETQELREQLLALQRQVSDMAVARQAQPKRRGRPPKQKDETA